MKKILLFFLVVTFSSNSSAQFKALMQKKANVIAPRQRYVNTDLPVLGEQPPNHSVSNKNFLTDPVTSVTRYDLQTNRSNQKRVYLHPDGTIGAVTTWSQQDASWTDRGSGYNYFNGTTWGPQPTARVESIKVGWGEYLPFGADGEMIVAHYSNGPLVINKRTSKGTGLWTETVMPALPSNITSMMWPRSVTNGPDHTYIHIIALTLPSANGGQPYNGMDGALLYCHSLDGGNTWTDWTQIPGITSADYTMFSGDSYSFAEPRGNTIAFTAGDSWKDQFLMKSTDNGMTWTKTIIHHSLYDLGGNSPGYFYCPDATMAVALDNQGIAHVVFGLLQDSGSRIAGYNRPYTQGIVYWNEHMPELRQDLHPDSLFANGQYVGWVKDTNVFSPPSGVQLAYYYTSLTSNPEIIIDNENRLFLLWTGVTSRIDPNWYMLRHIYGRDGFITPDGNVIWHSDTLTDITADESQYNNAECMYPSVSPTTDSNLYILFQRDDYAGCYINSISGCCHGQSSPDDNFITLLKWRKPAWINLGVTPDKPTFSVAQNYPNPATGKTKINVYIQNPGDLELKITNLTGQTMMSMEKANVLPGVSEFVIDGSRLASGVYFYTVQQGDKRITKKMIVQ